MFCVNCFSGPQDDFTQFKTIFSMEETAVLNVPKCHNIVFGFPNKLNTVAEQGGRSIALWGYNVFLPPLSNSYRLPSLPLTVPVETDK